jgi:hypothetical protein
VSPYWTNWKRRRLLDDDDGDDADFARTERRDESAENASHVPALCLGKMFILCRQIASKTVKQAPRV